MNYSRIKEARKKAKLTQEQLASVLGVNRATVSKYENGEITPPIDQLENIARATKTPVDFFLYGTTQEDLTFESLAADLLCYGFSIKADDTDPTWCYIYPTSLDDEPCFILHDEAKHLPIAFLESNLREIISMAEKAKKRFVTSELQKFFDKSIGEADLLFAQFVGDL